MERRYLALMFTDIVGYSKLMGQNESQTIALVEEYRKILLAKIDEYEGQVIEFIGDAVFARFDNVLKSVQAGIAIQNALRDANQQREASAFKLRSRIGIHAGDVTLKNGALFGDDVNIAARLEPLAVADGIAVSSAVYDAVKKHINVPVKRLGKQSLKNIQHKTRVYLLKPDGIRLSTHAHYALRTFNQFVAKQRYPIAACIIALFIAGYYFIPRWLVPGYTANYVEIADFKNLMSEDGQADYFSAGITEALRSQLADIDDVYILEADKGIRAPVRLEGSVQRAGDNLRIAYRLFRREDNVQIAGGKLDGSYSDIFILQDRVVAEIAGFLAGEFSLPSFRPAFKSLTESVTAYDYFMRGLRYQKLPITAKNLDEIIKHMSTALIHDGTFAEAYASMCHAYVKKYSLNQDAATLGKAEKYCNDSISINKSSIGAYVSRAELHRIRGEFSEAESMLNQAIGLDRDDAGANIQLAQFYTVTGEIKKAEKVFLDAINKSKEDWYSYHVYAAFLLALGRAEESIPVLKKALEIIPENEPVLNDLAVAYFYLSDYKKAADSFHRAVSLVPSAYSYSNTGTLYYYVGNFIEAEEMFKQAIKLSPRDYRFYMNLADVQRHLGEESVAISNYYKAIELAKSAILITPEDYLIYQSLALSYLFLNDVKNAKNFLDIALQKNSEDAEVKLTQVRFWAFLKEFDKALAPLGSLFELGYSKRLIESDPDLSEFVESKYYINFKNQ